MTGSISAVSTPADSAFRETQRTKTWVNATIKEMATEIAGKAGIALFWDVQGAEFTIESIEQSKKTDCEFLMSLCDTYGYSMKVYANKIVIFDREEYKAGAAFARLLCGRARKAGSLFREDSARYSGGAEICSLLFCRAGWKCGGSCGKPTAVRRPAVSFSRLYGGKRGGNPLLPHDIGPFSGRSAGRGGLPLFKTGHVRRHCARPL